MCSRFVPKEKSDLSARSAIEVCFSAGNGIYLSGKAVQPQFGSTRNVCTKSRALSVGFILN